MHNIDVIDLANTSKRLILRRMSKYTIDASHTHAQFSVRHMMVSNVRGELTEVSGEAVIDDSDIGRSSVNVTFKTASINSRDAKRDEHLRSPDFFDVEKFPTITFKSTKVTRSGENLQVVGDLTIRGTTRSVTLNVEELTDAITDPWGNQRRGARAAVTIDRKDFGLVWNAQLDKGGVAVGDKVSITVDAEFVAVKG
jgi:polyisoprenoid-binding protein YceI